MPVPRASRWCLDAARTLAQAERLCRGGDAAAKPRQTHMSHRLKLSLRPSRTIPQRRGAMQQQQCHRTMRGRHHETGQPQPQPQLVVHQSTRLTPDVQKARPQSLYPSKAPRSCP
ncbi:hypothetical protein BD779DRAFT_1789893 [Infundibulicybe gibba]|nr:hypothetical protein BD779DRAFT_1791373 [Infundibulicybe gibba]KAF8874669.1 hypothetical protein BD779DRAFT_1790439 [Infundibulicybe gibba]KAF8876403.1 hypothetical protein BD779DRAFT_1789893 [Infundibulicybe gibba]